MRKKNKKRLSLLFSILIPKLLKKVLERSKFHEKNAPGKNKKEAESVKPLYTQILSKNIDSIFKIKKNFLELSNKKIIELNKLIFNNLDKPRPRINMKTKGSLYKQIIVLMSSDNANKFMLASSKHITNFNYILRSTKSNLAIDFICVDYWSLIITSNRVMSLLEISIVSNYVKNYNNIDTNNIQDARLLQLKLYLKILSIPYIMEGTNMPINFEVMEIFIKATHIFNNINIASKPHIVKVFPKSNLAIV